MLRDVRGRRKLSQSALASNRRRRRHDWFVPTQHEESNYETAIPVGAGKVDECMPERVSVYSRKPLFTCFRSGIVVVDNVMLVFTTCHFIQY